MDPTHFAAGRRRRGTTQPPRRVFRAFQPVRGDSLLS